MRRDAFCADDHLGLALMPGGNEIGGGFADDRKIWPEALLFEQVFQPYPITILFIHCARDVDPLS